MPSTMPGISIANAQKPAAGHRPDYQAVPEVDRVLGKTGRAETPTRFRAALDARNRDHAEAHLGVAQGGHVVLRLGAGVGAAVFRRVTPIICRSRHSCAS